jgi:hypothetical protein
MLNEHKTRCAVGLARVAIGGQWRADFLRRKKPEFTVSGKRRAAIVSNLGPKVEKESRVVLEWTTEIAVLAKIDGLIKDLRENPGVLEEIVLRRRFGRAVCERPISRQPGYEIFGVDNRSGREA